MTKWFSFSHSVNNNIFKLWKKLTEWMHVGFAAGIEMWNKTVTSGPGFLLNHDTRASGTLTHPLFCSFPVSWAPFSTCVCFQICRALRTLCSQGLSLPTKVFQLQEVYHVLICSSSQSSKLDRANSLSCIWIPLDATTRDECHFQN